MKIKRMQDDARIRELEEYFHAIRKNKVTNQQVTECFERQWEDSKQRKERSLKRLQQKAIRENEIMRDLFKPQIESSQRSFYKSVDRPPTEQSPTKDNSEISNVFDRLTGDSARRSASRKIRDVIKEQLLSTTKPKKGINNLNLSVASLKSNLIKTSNHKY